MENQNRNVIDFEYLKNFASKYVSMKKGLWLMPSVCISVSQDRSVDLSFLKLISKLSVEEIKRKYFSDPLFKNKIDSLF